MQLTFLQVGVLEGRSQCQYGCRCTITCEYDVVAVVDSLWQVFSRNQMAGSKMQYKVAAVALRTTAEALGKPLRAFKNQCHSLKRKPGS